MKPAKAFAVSDASHSVSVQLFLPDKPPDGIVYLHAEPEEDLLRQLAGLPAALALVTGEDWERDLSPWPAAKAFRGGRSFAGGAPDYFAFFTQKLMPAVETGPLQHLPRILAGYSLAGLFAIWSLWQSDLFDGAASMSGSLWYDGLEDYLAQTPCVLPRGIYLSLGEAEAHTSNARLACIGAKTDAVCSRLKELGVPVMQEWHPGGHFEQVPTRTAQGVRQAVALLGWQ